MIAQNGVCNSLLLQEAVIGKYSKSILVRKKDVKALKKDMSVDDANILAGSDDDAPKKPNLFN